MSHLIDFRHQNESCRSCATAGSVPWSATGRTSNALDPSWSIFRHSGLLSWHQIRA